MRGLEALGQADVVVYDMLANRDLLRHTRPGAECIAVGQREGGGRDQQRINEMLLEHARRGCRVVRLKGGDPYLFGRGAEEMAYLGLHGIECEVIAGVTAGIAAPMAAGISLTRRDLASTVTFLTGHENAEKCAPSVDYPALAAMIRSGGTACLYMGMGRLDAIAKRLVECGLDAGTPAAAIQWGHTPRQRSVRAALGTIAARVVQKGLGPPSIVVIGAVCGVDEPSMMFYVRRALFGRCVLVTRTRSQASLLVRILADLGAEVIEAPTIEIAPPPDLAPVDKAIAEIDRFDWILLTSPNAVEGLARRLDHLERDSRHLASVRIGALGDATAEALRGRLGLRADLVPEQFVAEALADAIIARREASGRKFLWLRADIARATLRDRLVEAGGYVLDHSVYVTRPAGSLPQRALAAVRERRLDWITFTSSSTAKYLVELLGAEAELIQNVKTASIGPITSRTMRGLGMEPTVEASPSSMEGLVEAMMRCEGESRG